MKITYKGSLQRTMIVYFLLIGFASSLIGPIAPRQRSKDLKD